MFIQFIVSMIATLSFAVLFCAPKSELLFCGLTGAIGWIVYLFKGGCSPAEKSCDHLPDRRYFPTGAGGWYLLYFLLFYYE